MSVIELERILVAERLLTYILKCISALENLQHGYCIIFVAIGGWIELCVSTLLRAS